jgi:ABC-type sugar transport system substrate-binding protein
VLKAAEDAGLLNRLSIIATDLFPALVDSIHTGNVAETIYRRPRTQGRLAFRLLREFRANGTRPSFRVTLAPHLILRGNIDFFLDRRAAAQGISGARPLQ